MEKAFNKKLSNMIKKLFKWLYLLISGLCFLLVIATFFFVIYLANNEPEVQSFFEDFDAYRTERAKEETQEDFLSEVDEEAEQATIFSVESFSESDNKRVKNYILNNEPKIKLKLKDGVAFLRPSDILFVESGTNSHIVTTINNTTIQLNKRALPLYKLNELLENIGAFYKTKFFIINCHYVQQLIKDTNRSPSQPIVVMDNGKEVPMANQHVNPLLKRLENIHQ